MESNTFKNGSLAGALAVGLALMAGAFVIDPFGRPVVMVSWCFVLGGLMFASVPGRPRAVGFGLALAGAIAPFTVFLWFWVVVSVGVLGGSLR